MKKRVLNKYFLRLIVRRIQTVHAVHEKIKKRFDSVEPRTDVRYYNIKYLGFFNPLFVFKQYVIVHVVSDTISNVGRS